MDQQRKPALIRNTPHRVRASTDLAMQRTSRRLDVGNMRVLSKHCKAMLAAQYQWRQQLALLQGAPLGLAARYRSMQ